MLRGRGTGGSLDTKVLYPGSHKMAYMWAAYANMDTIGNYIYLHSSMNHSPRDQEIPTQNVENMWTRAKRKLKRQFGTLEEWFGSYLDKFTFKSTSNHDVSHFARFLAAMATVPMNVLHTFSWHLICGFYSVTSIGTCSLISTLYLQLALDRWPPLCNISWHLLSDLHTYLQLVLAL